VVLRVDDADLPSAFVLGRVCGADGAPVAGTRLSLHRTGWKLSISLPDAMSTCSSREPLNQMVSPSMRNPPTSPLGEAMLRSVCPFRRVDLHQRPWVQAPDPEATAPAGCIQRHSDLLIGICATR
jgi:hypothetical protein